MLPEELPPNFEFALELSRVEKLVWNLSTRLPLTDFVVTRGWIILSVGIALLSAFVALAFIKDWFYITYPTNQDFLIPSYTDTIFYDQRSLALQNPQSNQTLTP